MALLMSSKVSAAVSSECVLICAERTCCGRNGYGIRRKLVEQRFVVFNAASRSCTVKCACC